MKLSKTILVFLTFNLVYSAAKIDDLKIISFNIRGFKTNKIEKKINEIIDNIQEFDIFFFQENWGFDQLLKRKLSDYKIISKINNNKIFGSGLTIGVRNIEIIDVEEVLFNTCNGLIFNGSDCFASKGFLFSRIRLSNKYIDIYNTHLDAGKSERDIYIRSLQLNKLKKYILDKSSNNPLIICGDFNIDYSIEKQIIDAFMKELELKINLTSSENKIDYIFHSEENQVFRVFNNIYNNKLNYLSDHKPLSIKVSIK